VTFDVVTGGAGFIGSHIVAALLERGRRVRVVDNFITGHPANVQRFITHPGFEVVKVDIRDRAAIARAVDGAEVVFHQAALASVPRSIDDPVASHEANAGGTLNVLIAARDAKVKRVVYAGSSSAYGDNPVSPKHEDLPAQPISPYAASKLAGEHYCRAFSAAYGLSTVCLRYFNVFGPRQDPKSQYAAAIPLFVTSVLAGKPPTVYGDGEQSRDFTYIENVVSANLLAAAAPANLMGESINVACGSAVTVNRILLRINELLGMNVPAEHIPARVGDIRHSLADISLARKLLGYEPAVDFDEGLQRAIEWYRSAAT